MSPWTIKGSSSIPRTCMMGAAAHAVAASADPCGPGVHPRPSSPTRTHETKLSMTCNDALLVRYC